MASTLHHRPFLFFLLILLPAWHTGLAKPRTKMAEKLSTIEFYWHDIVNGANRSDYAVLRRPNKGGFGFGSISMVDIPLTKGPQLESRVVGRAQGLYASSSMETSAYLMVINFYFTSGRYKESTLTVLGRNDRGTSVRELPVIGGAGAFRFCRGYVQLSTHSYNSTTLYAILKLKAYVLHF